ncbi:hypothetical protein [uncultured Sphingomonas sp.]|uniref:hypothetical protein n=1 Tax=uncultured Sphingomonas sp. TaxID=158754 RepID=UPI0025E980C0|nr:hypothetical protein [uncultured Sphingomonas sp.]
MVAIEATQQQMKAVGGWKGHAEVATYVADAAREQLAEAAIAKFVSQFSDERGSRLCLTVLCTVCPTYPRIAHLRHSSDRLVIPTGGVDPAGKHVFLQLRGLLAHRFVHTTCNRGCEDLSPLIDIRQGEAG